MYIGPTLKNLTPTTLTVPVIAPVIAPTTSTSALTAPVIAPTTSRVPETLTAITSLATTSTSTFTTFRNLSDELLRANIQQNPNKFRIDLLNLLRHKYKVNEYETIDLQLENLDLCKDLLLYWVRDATIEDLLKEPVINFNDE